jgi:hypothetical protein
MLTRLPSSSERPWSTGASNLPMNLKKPARFAADFAGYRLYV